MSKFKIFISYCLPALIALVIILYGYYGRTQNVVDTIMLYKTKVDGAAKTKEGVQGLVNAVTQAKRLANDEGTTKQNTIVELIEYLSQSKQKIINNVNHMKGQKADASVTDKDIETYFRSVLLDIWESNAAIISLMVLLPYIIFASRLVFSPRITLSDKEKLASTWMNWWMKFSVACVMTIGWIYLLNPTGRGESTIAQFLIKQDLSKTDTLPIYIKSENIVPVMAGFLGWYLYLLSYFFSKLVHHDVVSSRVYNLMFKKFLFTYGIAMVLPSIEVASSASSLVKVGQGQSIFMFFVGYFPLAAFSMLKEAGLKFGGNLKSDSGYLTELPGISRWQVLRLEEEGIDNMAALAYADQKRLQSGLLSMATVISFWIDVAQLYVILGDSSYQKIKERCKTASGFLQKVDDKDFQDFLTSAGIGDSVEISTLLRRTFSDKLIK